MQVFNKYFFCLILLSLTPQGLGAVGTCSSSCQFVPGPPGRDGRDGAPGSPGAPGNPGAPGAFSYSNVYLRLKEELLTELRQQLLQELRSQSGCLTRPTVTASQAPSMYIPYSSKFTSSEAVRPSQHVPPSADLSQPRDVSPTPMPSSQPTPQPLPCTLELGLSEDNPVSSCGDILQCNPEATSQDYWIQTINGSRLMYCHMEEDKCGVRGVMRVVNINMTNPEETCPSPLTLYMANGTRVCGHTGPLDRNEHKCTSVTFPTFNYQYSHVCGRAVGFTYYSACAFAYSLPFANSQSDTIWFQNFEGSYVSGVSITHGAPGNRTHIWTYAGGAHESGNNGCNCPCAKVPGRRPPSYVGEHYYCESATQYTPPRPQRWYTNNTLWDNEDCYPGSNCCNTPRAPWFVRDFDTTTSDDVEIRWCTSVGLIYDRVATEQVEIYVY